ncbi:PAP2 superfamily protein [Catalinimonas alkaloidigena]|uniref:PAP2 superfamily protein n=1 Tax=Catalinimonas alkaloidigena TaxID=1075417 RepID=A0A1G9GZE4_9BACT|nr:vanadium-dependent haloperoxidase [Catalinimonas alkaloidigena]SDL06029.1 PAP2 superfamily protein [Catalinimonas alkaloidigena]
MKKLLVILLTGLLAAACSHSSQDYKESAADPALLRQSWHRLTDVIVHDIFSPPVASRIYAYSSVAAYETLLPAHPEYKSLAGQLNDLTPAPQPDTTQEYCYPLASLHAYLTVGRAMIFSEDSINNWEARIHQRYHDLGVPDEVFDRSVAYGQQVADHVLAWAKQDGYNQTRGQRHTVSTVPGTWKPTPPAYMDAIEPFWNKIRPFVIDSASQFQPDRPTSYTEDMGGAFMADVKKVYETGNNLTPEQREIASFWDCNPFVMNTTGHVMFATKKITPGGHWLGITSIVTEKDSADLMETAEAYALVSVTLADAFIACWDEKYRSNYIRPETAINQFLDETWEPVLQTPPFPEYPSGHSVISTAAAEMLTSLYGDSFSFADSTEQQWGLPMRHFDSFRQAAQEAAISRLYGGIHFMPAINNGVDEGRKVGQYIIGKLQTRHHPLADKQALLKKE